jgi:uncharacterized membrane protein
MCFLIRWVEDLGPVLLVTIKGKQYYLCICHHRKDRSIWFFGLEKMFCARCCGILTGFIAGVILRIFKIHFSVTMSIIFILPLVIDGLSQLLGFRESKNYIRLLTGIAFGLGCILLRIK